MTETLVQLEGPRRSQWIDRPLDNTALNAYMECPSRYNKGMAQHRRQRSDGSNAPSPAIAYGSTWHKILETHYATGGDWEAVFRASVMSWKAHDRAEDHRTQQRAMVEYERYLQRWGQHDEDVTQYGTTVGYPDVPILEKSVELWWPGALHPYTGKIDRIILHQGLYYVEDHKTTSQVTVDGPSSGYWFRQFDPNNQMMGYAWLAMQLTGLPIAGVRINAHSVLKTKGSFARQIFTFSRDRLEDWAENYNRWVRRIEASYQNNDWPHQFNACPGKYGQCMYTDVCALPERLEQRALEMDFVVQPWNPLEAEDEEL